MRKVTIHLLGALVASAWLAAACSSDSGRAPAVGSSGKGGNANASGGSDRGGTAQGGEGTSGGNSASGGRADAGAGGGGESGEVGSGGAPDSGGEGGGPAAGGAPPDPGRCASDDEPAEVPVLSAVCDSAMAWGAGMKILEMGGDGDQLIGVTPDELTVVWFDARGSEGTFRLSDRSARDAAFASGVDLPRGVIALSPDGLRLVVSSGDQSELLEHVRPARGEAFAEGEAGTLALLNEDANAHGYRVLDAVIAPDDKSLYYNVTTSDGDEYPLRVSKRTGTGPWPVGEPIELCEFKGFAGLVRHPTAVSADGLTLFFYDPRRRVARAAFRRTESDPFSWFIDLGERYQATPSESCEHLYYSANDQSGTSIFVSGRE